MSEPVFAHEWEELPVDLDYPTEAAEWCPRCRGVRILAADPNAPASAPYVWTFRPADLHPDRCSPIVEPAVDF